MVSFLSLGHILLSKYLRGYLSRYPQYISAAREDAKVKMFNIAPLKSFISLREHHGMRICTLSVKIISWKW